LPAEQSDRRVTRRERTETTVAVLVHDAPCSTDPGLLEGIAAAARLTASNARLQAEVRAQVGEVEASRRSSLPPSTKNAGRLEQRLDQGARGDCLPGGTRSARAGSLARRDESRQNRHAQEQLATLRR